MRIRKAFAGLCAPWKIYEQKSRELEFGLNLIILLVYTTVGVDTVRLGTRVPLSVVLTWRS